MLACGVQQLANSFLIPQSTTNQGQFIRLQGSHITIPKTDSKRAAATTHINHIHRAIVSPDTSYSTAVSAQKNIGSGGSGSSGVHEVVSK